MKIFRKYEKHEGSIARRFAFVLAIVFFFTSPLLSDSTSRAESPLSWDTPEEAEAARVEAEQIARSIGQTYMKLDETATEAEEAADEAEEEAEELAEKLEEAREAAEKASGEEKDAAKQAVEEAEKELKSAEEFAAEQREKAEQARQEADAVYEELAEAAMVLKAATEASVLMNRAAAIDSSKIAGSFALGERYSNSFNQQMEPMYLRFSMTESSRVRITTTDAKVSLTILDSGGNTILTLVPSSTGTGSLCRLEEGEYTLLVSPIGSEIRKFSIAVNIDTSAEEEEEEDEEEIEFEDDEDETEMVVLMEFD